jgi:hypothetical protein
MRCKRREGLSVNYRIILKWFLKEQVVRMWTEYIWVRRGVAWWTVMSTVMNL